MRFLGLIAALVFLCLLAAGGYAGLLAFTPIDSGNAQARIEQLCLTIDAVQGAFSGGPLRSTDCGCVAQAAITANGADATARILEALRQQLPARVKDFVTGSVSPPLDMKQFGVSAEDVSRFIKSIGSGNCKLQG
jgi:hypothetical protein